MAKKNKEVRDQFIAKLRPFKRVEPVPRMSSVYTTFNEVLLDVRYSGLSEKGSFWFFMDTHRLNEWRGKQRFLECFICGDENTVLLVPDEKIFEWYKDIEPNRKGHWFLTVEPEDGLLKLKIGHGRPEIDARAYLNRFDLISPIIPRPLPKSSSVSRASQASFEEIRAAILEDTRLTGDSLHSRVINMLVKIGEWEGYQAKREYRVELDSPYTLDVVWLHEGELDMAIEVHDGGNETEAKDRLRQALRYGTRKVVIVSSPPAMARLKNICRFETELKNWLEIWSINRVYRMYRNGYDFFEDFLLFRRRQRFDEVTEFV